MMVMMLGSDDAVDRYSPEQRSFRGDSLADLYDPVAEKL